jgi:hypothetical protein
LVPKLNHFCHYIWWTLDMLLKRSSW